MSSSQIINLADTSNQNSYISKTTQTIQISALPTRQNSQVDLPSFSIPLQYNLGSFKKLDDTQLDLEASTSDHQPQNPWDTRMMPNFNLMNIKPLLENRDNLEMAEVKYEVKNENVRSYNEMTNSIQASMEPEDILGKESVTEGQTISPDFEIDRYQNYHSENEKRYRQSSFDDSIIEDGRNDFVCDNDFLCKNNFEKVDGKRNDFEDCHLLDTDHNVAVNISNFESNI